MRNFKFNLMFALMAIFLLGGAVQATAAGPRKAWSETDGVYYLSTRDGQEETYAVEGSITFKAVPDGKTIASYRDCGVTFKPAHEGEVLQITVNSIDLSGENYLLLYDGAVTGIGKSDNTRTGEQSHYLPDGWVKWYTSASAGETYKSTAQDGALSFGFHSRNPESQKGFNITITSLSPKDMEYKGMEIMGNENGVNRGAKDQMIFGVNVKMEGSNNALSLNSLKIDCNALAGSTQVTNTRLYYGKQLLSTAATVGNALEATDVTLKSGDNLFTVVCDITPDASGTIPSLTLSNLQVNGDDKTIETATGNGVNVHNVILMTSEATTFTIGDDAAFYDDGGKDGKIGSKFNGTITFVPATAGQAIKIDFSKLAIFNTSSVGYNDIFKFYNGRTADESNLITTLLKDAKIVKSTADDGSMTVTLKSVTGVPADGWEAIVSQFLPGDMVFKSITAKVAGQGTVAAGDKEQKMILVDVMTDNTSNALHATRFNFTTTDVKNIDKVKLYYLGESETAELSSTNLVGEGTMSGQNLTVTTDKELLEGHNFFVAVIDVKETALNGEKVNLKLASATIGGVEQTPGEAIAECTIDNVCRAKTGSHSHTIYDTWTFLNAVNPYYSDKYETEQADYIVTFTPAEAGAMAQLDFSEFDVTYSASSYGTKATFEVYSGSRCTSENLLWALNSAEQAKTGPGHTLRSTAANGAITVKFNPNTTSSYYAGKGWKATVTPFKNHAMEIQSVTVNQSSTEVVSPGMTDAQIIDFNVMTEGTLTTKTIKAVNLDLKGCQASVAKVSVKCSKENDFAGATLFGSVEHPSETTVAVTGEAELADGNNYFWVTLDVAGDAAAETLLDAQLVSIADEALAITPVEHGDPEGGRVVKYIVNMETGNKVVTVNNPLMFYDDGGADGPTKKGFEGVITFVPGKPGYAVELATKSFSTGQGKFYLYKGSEVNDDNLIDTYSYNKGPGSVISKAADGAFTVRYTGPTSTYSDYDGFAIEVKLHELVALSADSITPTPVSREVVRGSSNALMQKIAVTVAGDRGCLKLNNIKFNTTGSTEVANIENAKLYYTSKTDNFNDKNLVATIASVGGENTLVAESPIELTDNGTYYLWLTYDLASDATIGNKVDAAVTSITVDETEMPITGIAAERAIKGGLKGNFVIGSSSKATYPTFAEATAALAGGIEGPVTFTVEPGTYAENVTISRVEGVSAKHPLTFVGESGNAADVIIKGSGYEEPPYGGFKAGMFLIDSTSYVTLKNMSFVPQSQSYPSAIHIYNQSRHVTIDSVAVTADPVTGSSVYNGINLIQAKAKDEDGKNNDFLTIQNCTLNGGYIALYLGGTNYVRLTREEGLVVKNNVISEAGSKGIYVTDEDNAVIDGNVIAQSTTQKSSYHGIDLFRLRGGNTVVRNNKITNTHNSYSYGIELRQECYGSEEHPILVYNNSISITNSSTSSSGGIEIDGDNKNISVIYNSIRIDGNKGHTFYSARARSNEMFTGITLQNNLMQNMTKVSNMFFFGNYASRVAFRNNAFSTNGAIMPDVADSTAMAAACGNATNITDSADFVSETDLQLKSAGKLNCAAPVDFITTDQNGVERDAAHPTIGAYEYRTVVVVAPEIEDGYPVVSNVAETTASVKTKWNVSGKLYAKVEKQAAAGSPALAPGRKMAQLPRHQVTVDEVTSTTPVDYTAGSEATSKFTELEPSTRYKAYFVLESAIDGSQSELTECEFTTLRHIDPLKIVMDVPYTTINNGESAIIVPQVSGGDEPYTYEWRDQMNHVLGNKDTLKVTPEYTYGYKLTVTSADGQSATAKTGVYVLREAVKATFDDNFLPEESYFRGDSKDDVFYSGSYAFHVGYFPEFSAWSGYGMSNQTSTEFKGLDDQFHSSAGHGYSNSSNYCVAYPSGMYIDVTNSLDGDEIGGVWVTNSAYAINSMSHGDSYGKAFETGDWFMATATGTAADGSTKSVDFYLADYRSQDVTEHYMVQDWTWMDLSALGRVKKVTFTFKGSDTGKFGLNTPAYICLDNLNDKEHMPTSINDTRKGVDGVQVTVSGNTIMVGGAKHVAVYTAAGAQVSAGSTCIDVAPGVYIVVADGKAQKILVR